MGTVLDAYALVALIADEPAAGEVERLARSGAAVITSINLAEAVDVCCRVHRLGEEEVAAVIDPMVVAGAVVVVAPEASHAWDAAHLRLVHYRRRERPISIADCFLLAAAEPGDRVATSDPAVAAAARSEGIDVIALPDSAGVRP